MDEDFVRTALSTRNLNVTFYEDQEDGGANAQIFRPQGPTAIEHWPPGASVAVTRAVSYLFPEGTHAVGDGGTLDLGIVRDSTLNSTNDLEMFCEGWEAIVPKVIESWKVTSDLCDFGVGSLDVTDACAGAS